MFANSLLAANLFFTASLNATLLLYVARRPGRAELAVVTTTGLLLLLCFGVPATPGYAPVFVAGAYGGAAALLISIIHVFGSASRRQIRMALLAEAAAPLLSVALLPALVVSGYLNPVYDRYLYAADGAFGFQPGFAAARFLLSHTWLRIPSEIAYMVLPVAMAAVYVALRKRSGPQARLFFRTVLALAVCGYIGYFLCPAVGSAIAFHDIFPYKELAVRADWIRPVNLPLDPRNCMPSLHAAWAIILWRFSAHLARAFRLTLLPYLILTLIEVIGCGGHYLVDVVAALPFALAVDAVAAQPALGHRQARRQAAVNAILFFGWLALIRFGIGVLMHAPLVPWMLAIGTGLVSLVSCAPAGTLHGLCAGGESEPPIAETVLRRLPGEQPSDRRCAARR